MKKHLLFVTNSTIGGGAEIYLKNLLNRLTSYDLSISIAYPPRGEIKRLYKKLKAKKYFISLGRGTIGLKGLNLYSPAMFFYYFRLKKLIKRINQKNKIDLLFVQQDPKEKILAAAIGRKLNIPVILIEHSKLHPWQEWPHFSWLYRHFANRANRIIAVSNAVKKSLIQIGVKSKKIKVVWNGVEIKRLSGDEIINFKRKFGLKNKIIFGLCSRLTKNKGVYDLFIAAQKVLRKNKKIAFLIIGSGKEETNLKKKILGAKLEKQITMLGFKRNAAALNALFDVVVSPSFDEGEGLPLRIIEGMALAKPVIATDTSGTREEVFDKINGYLIRPHDILALQEKILLLADDPILRKKMGQKSFEIYQKNFTLDRMVAKTYQKIVEVIDKKQNGRANSQNIHKSF